MLQTKARSQLLLALLALVLTGSIALSAPPEQLFLAVVAACGIGIVLMRPHWGVAALLVFLLVRYGRQRTPLGYTPTFSALISGGSGLLTLNNVLGLLLGVLMIYRIYRNGDWRYLNTPEVKLIALATVLLVFSAYVNWVDPLERAGLGLPVGRQDPRRLIVGRTLFLLLVVYFVRSPRHVRLLVGVFLILTFASALGGLRGALGGMSGARLAAAYRAGGRGVIIGAAGNPNRLALVCTLALVLLWEYRSTRMGGRLTGVLTAGVALLVLTVFSTASRGGVVGLGATVLLLVARRRQGLRPLIYGVLALALGAVLVGQLLPRESAERLSNMPAVSESATQEGTGSLRRREHAMRLALRIAAAHPLLGVGVGNWEIHRFRIDPLRSIAVPHNSYLLALAEGGVFCLLAYLVAFGKSVQRLGRISRDPAAMRRAAADGLDWVIRAVRVCLLSFMVFSLFGDLWEFVVFYLLFGLSAVLGRMYAGEGGRLPVPA